MFNKELMRKRVNKFGIIRENKVELFKLKHQLIPRYQVVSGKEEFHCMTFSDFDTAYDKFLKIVNKREKNRKSKND